MSNLLTDKTDNRADTPDLRTLETYFRRIGYQGNPGADLKTLQEIHRLHPAAIPFENLNPLMRWPVRLDPESIQEKLVMGGRGGYCFEHNLLLKQMLGMMGFKVRGLGARVVWNVPEGVTTARGHMLLLVEVEEQAFIADVGFGGLTLTAPLLLAPSVEQPTPHEPFRLLQTGEEYVLQALVKAEWKPLYRFGLQEQLLPDYEVTSWYLCNHPSSHFIHGLIAAKSQPDGRYALHNLELSFHDRNGHTEKKAIGSAQELRETLENVFGLNLTSPDEVEDTLEKLYYPNKSGLPG